MTMLHHRRRARLGVSYLASVLLGAACSSGGSAEVAPTVASTRPATSTTSSTVRTTTTTMATTTTTEAVVAPLTGVPIIDLTILQRPAVVVKIDNHPSSLPQTGLNQADIVFEEIVEGGITRFAAVFHSTGSDPVGPVRSGRTSDVDILAYFRYPMLVWSGGNNGVVAAIRRAAVQDVGHGSSAGSLYFRDRSRAAPHNLFTNLSALLPLANENTLPPVNLFSYRDDGAPSAGVSTPAVAINYRSIRAEYRWDAGVGGWVRSEYGKIHLDSTGAQIAPQNVVILFTKYGRSAADPASPEAKTVGSGEAWVLSDGKVVQGTWTRASAADVATLVDASGQPMLLTPGRTWIALPEAGMGEILSV